MVDGILLADNLYSYRGKYRYRLPDGKFRYFKAATVHEANTAAIEANNNRDNYVPGETKESGYGATRKVIEDFIALRERTSPSLNKSNGWKNRKYALRKFAREFAMSPSRLDRTAISAWWDQLTYSQQKLRHAEFRKFFNFAMGRNLYRNLEYNPFSTADDKPRLYLNGKPERSRLRLTAPEFWDIYKSAESVGYIGLQIAMGLSLVTFMREGDILELQFEAHVKGDLLQRIISKSAAQLGHTKASRRQWDSTSHTLLRQLLTKAKRLSLKSARCPYIVSHMPEYRIKASRIKTHIAQMTKERLIEQFDVARDLTGLWDDMPKGSKAPTFREVRALADMLASKKGYELKTIQKAMAHSDSAVTLMYQSNHKDMPYDDVEVIFDEDMIGGNFT